MEDLFRMSSGLDFTLYEVMEQTPQGTYRISTAYPDHYYVYPCALDVFQYAVSRRLRFPPGTVGRYRNCDPLTLGYLVRRAVEQRGEQYHTFPQRSLFDRIGIRRMVLDTDPYGNFILSGYEYGTVRDWARIGLLYLQGASGRGSGSCPKNSWSSSGPRRRRGSTRRGNRASRVTAPCGGSIRPVSGTPPPMPSTPPEPAARTRW